MPFRKQACISGFKMQRPYASGIVIISCTLAALHKSYATDKYKLSTLKILSFRRQPIQSSLLQT